MEDWDALRIFLATVRAETLSGAGRALRMDAATVGRRLARLEADIGQVLFVKSPQGYTLTDAGARLLPAAEAAEQAARAAQDAFRSAGEGLSGQVRIGAPDGCANHLLPQVCARLARENPELEIQILALPRVVNLSKREADLAISVSPPTGGRLLVQKISDYRLVLAAARDYLAAHPPLRARGDLEAHRLVGYIPDMIFDKELDYMAELGLKPAVFGSNSAAVQLNWVRQGAGIGIVHAFALPAAPEVAPVLPETVSLTRRFHLLRHADDRHRRGLTRLAERLVREMRREIAALESAALGPAGPSPDAPAGPAP
jgi:DNA-binding transcriptional LysR family regulator